MIFRRHMLVSILFLTIFFLVSCKDKQEEQQQPEIVEAPYEEAPYVPDYDYNLSDVTVEENEEEVVYVILADKEPVELGEWFSVRDGVFMRVMTDKEAIYLSIQNQALYSWIESILVLSKDGKDKYAFFLPAELIPPYDYQTDYVATPLEGDVDVDAFRVITAGGENWNQLLLLAQDTEVNQFTRSPDAVRELFQSVYQTRFRSSFEQLDFSRLAPDIQWIEKVDDNEGTEMGMNHEIVDPWNTNPSGDTDVEQQQSVSSDTVYIGVTGIYYPKSLNDAQFTNQFNTDYLHKYNSPPTADNTNSALELFRDAKGLSTKSARDTSAPQTTQPPPQPTQAATMYEPEPSMTLPGTSDVPNSSLSAEIYDLNINPQIEVNGMKISNLVYSPSSNIWSGFIMNNSNKNPSITLEFLDENWNSLGTLAVTQDLPLLGNGDMFFANAVGMQYMEAARFVRVV